MAEPIRVGPWPGGVNLEDIPESLNNQELSRCENWRVDPTGLLIKRPGHTRESDICVSNADAAGAEKEKIVNFLYRFYYGGGSRLLIAASNSFIRKLVPGSPDVWTKIGAAAGSSSVFHATNLGWAFAYKDRLYTLDGTQGRRYEPGNDYRVNIGIPVPLSSDMTNTPGSGSGAMTSSVTYKYKLTYVTTNMGEGGTSSFESVTMGGSDTKVDLANIPVAAADYEVLAKRLYRTLADGSIYYYLGEMSAATTVYTDLTADVDLGDEIEVVDPPPAIARFGLVGPDERAYYCGMASPNDSLVDVSDVGFPDRILEDDFFVVNPGDGDSITGLARVRDGIIFFKRNSIWYLRSYGYGLVPVESKRVGCVAPWSVTEVPGGVIFLGTDSRVYFTDGTEAREIGRKVRPEFRGMSEGALFRVVATFHDWRYIIAYDFHGSKGYNHKVLEFDTVGQKWDGPHENGTKLTPSYFSVWDGAGDSNELTWGEGLDLNTSLVYIRNQFSVGDIGLNPNALARTKTLDIAGTKEKVAYRALSSISLTADGYLRISILSDDRRNKSDAFFVLGTPSTDVMIWGTSLWGATTWGGKVTEVYEKTYDVVAGSRGRKPMIEISDDGTAAEVKVESIEILFNVLGHK